MGRGGSEYSAVAPQTCKGPGQSCSGDGVMPGPDVCCANLHCVWKHSPADKRCVYAEEVKENSTIVGSKESAVAPQTCKGPGQSCSGDGVMPGPDICCRNLHCVWKYDPADKRCVYAEEVKANSTVVDSEESAVALQTCKGPGQSCSGDGVMPGPDICCKNLHCVWKYDPADKRCVWAEEGKANSTIVV